MAPRKEAERAKNMFALGLMSWLYGRPIEATARLLEAKFGKQAGDRRGQRQGAPGRLRITARRPRSSRSVRGQARRRSRRARTATSPATRRWPRADRGRAVGRSCRCSSARTRSRRPPTSCTSCPGTSTSASARSRPRTRSPASARRSAPRSAGRWRHTTSGPGHRAEGRDARAGGDARAAAVICDVQRGGPSTGHADQDRAGRPAAWRSTAATASRRCRSCAAPTPADCFDAAIEAAGSR